MSFPVKDNIKMFSSFQQDQLTNSILKMLIQNFTEYDAYKLGIINSKGLEIKPFESLKTTEEKQAYTKLTRLCISLKKLINKYPSEKNKFRSYYVAMNTINDLFESIDHSEKILNDVEEKIKKIIDEDGETGTSSVETFDAPLFKIRRKGNV